MKETLNFLTKLGQDPALRARYRANPKAALAASKLNAGARAAIASGNLAQIRAAAGVEPASLPPKVVNVPGAFGAAA